MRAIIAAKVPTTALRIRVHFVSPFGRISVVVVRLYVALVVVATVVSVVLLAEVPFAGSSETLVTVVIVVGSG